MNGFTAPLGGDSKRIDNVELIHIGFQLCTFYGLCDIGTQDSGQFGPRHKVNLAFEFPKHYRVFYEGDDAKPACVFQFETLSMNKDSNLRGKFVEPMIGRKLTDAEAEVFDISSLLGKQYIATIVHSPDGKWANIQSIIALNEQNKAMFQLPTPTIEQINPTYFFHLSQGFESKNFENLPKFLREKHLMTSQEGIAHRAKGGIFAEPPKTNGNVQQGGIEMIDKTITYEAYKASGWTDELLIEKGIAKRIVASAPPAPVIATAPAPPITSVVQPIVQATAQSTIVPVVLTVPASVPGITKLVFKDANAQPLAVWLKDGWTEAQIVEQGYATFQ